MHLHQHFLDIPLWQVNTYSDPLYIFINNSRQTFLTKNICSVAPSFITNKLWHFLAWSMNTEKNKPTSRCPHTGCHKPPSPFRMWQVLSFLPYGLSVPSRGQHSHLSAFCRCSERLTDTPLSLTCLFFSLAVVFCSEKLFVHCPWARAAPFPCQSRDASGS